MVVRKSLKEYRDFNSFPLFLAYRYLMGYVAFIKYYRVYFPLKIFTFFFINSETQNIVLFRWLRRLVVT
jgi:hypothetical protein